MSALGTVLFISTFALPLAMLAMCISRKLRSCIPAMQWLAPLPALTAALLALTGPPLTFTSSTLQMNFFLDKPGALLLAVSALLWSGAGAVAARGNSKGGRFTVCWFLTMIGSFGVFIAADLLTFYLVYALVSIPAYGLVVSDEDAASKRAGGVYMAFAVLGEAFLLMGFAFLAAGDPNGSIKIHDVMAALPTSPWRDVALAMTIAGFGLKIALVPGHGWMPLTYTAAPLPAAAVLSGAAVKAGVIGLIRFLPFGTALPDWGNVLVIFGFISAFYGVAIGITQRDPKSVLAYSSISQMGVIAAVLGMDLSTGNNGAVLDAAFYATNHVLVKGALFLGIGVAMASPNNRRPVFLLLAVMALSLAGLPLTGGALAKLAVKDPLGNGVAGVLAQLSAAGTTLLMLHFLMRLAHGVSPHTDTTAAKSKIDRPWLVLAIASILAPWQLYPIVGGHGSNSLTFAAISDALWPMALGAALAVGFRFTRISLPSIPVGDMITGQEAAFRASCTLGNLFERLDYRLRQWPVAGLSLLVIALVLAAATKASN